MIEINTGNTILNFFNEEFGDVRVAMINREPWFVGKDVANILGYTKLDAMYRVVDKEDKLNIDPQSVENTGFPQNGGVLEINPNVRRMTLINEVGLYEAIFSSQLPQAKQFKRWVTKEVLPSIRKNGGYVDQQENLTIDELLEKMIEVGTKLIQEKRELESKCKKLESDIEKKDIKLKKFSESQEFLDTFFKSKNYMSMQVLAKTLCNEFPNLGRNKLIAFLREQKIFTLKNVPYQRYINQKLFKVRNAKRTDQYGNMRIYPTSLATAKGAHYIYNLVKKEYNAG